MPGILYLVPSPIGNLKEVSPRVIETLNSVDFVACEDTRNTQKLLNLLGINKKCISCHEHNELISSKNIIDNLMDGKNYAYMSDAGYPCISDPGHLLTIEAIKNDIKVVPLSGPNAFLNALVGSDEDTSHFLFYGFLDSKESAREKELEALKDFPFTLIFYEAPHRINDTLKSLYKILGERKITIARELTKMYEEFIRTSLSDLINNPIEFKGELVLVIEGAKKEENNGDLKGISDKFNDLLKLGYTKKDAINILSTLFKINKNDLKKEFINN